MEKYLIILLTIFCLSFAQESPDYFKENAAADSTAGVVSPSSAAINETAKAAKPALQELEEAEKIAQAKKAAVEEAKKKVAAVEAEKKQRACTGTCEAKWNDERKKKKNEAEAELAKRTAEAEMAEKLVANIAVNRQAEIAEAEMKLAVQAKQDSIIKAQETAEETAKKTAEEAAKLAAEQERLNAVANAIKQDSIANAQKAAKISIEMVRVEGSLFSMGCTNEQGFDCGEDERPTHNVQLNDFLISKYPVTQELWKKVMGNNPSHFSGEDLPVESVSWNEVQLFIKELNIKTGKKYRLLTEAEWEYAARGGRKSGKQKYSGNGGIDKVAWYNKNTNGTQPVGQKLPNELGLFDMNGNVWEWVQDWKDGYSNKMQFNPKGPASGSMRAFRGGSWQDPAVFCRITRRGAAEANFRSSDLGFRLALDP